MPGLLDEENEYSVKVKAEFIDINNSSKKKSDWSNKADMVKPKAHEFSESVWKERPDNVGEERKTLLMKKF